MDGKQLKNSILQWAIQGKLVPQNPKDEPAQKLLERVEKERNAKIKSGEIKLTKPEKNIKKSFPECDIPQGWCWCQLVDICRAFGRIGFRGYTKEDLVTDSTQGALSISPSNMKDHGMEYNVCTYISWKKYEESPEIKIENGDLLIVKTGSSYGKAVLVENLPCKATINPQIAVIKDVCIEKKYLLCFLQSPFAREKYEDFVLGTSIPTFSQANLLSIGLALPPLAEQKRIVAKLEQVLPLAEEYGAAQEQLDKLNKELPEALKKSILQEAIQGKLVPQNPKDEPAHKLLERITAARSEANQPKGAKSKKSAPTSRIYCENGTWYEQIGNTDPKDISEDIPFEIPENWTWCRMGDFISISTGLAYKKEDLDVRAKSYIRVLRGGNIDYGKWKIKDDDVLIAPQFVKDDLILKKGMFITPAVTSLEQMGKTALVEADQKDIVVGGFVLMMTSCFNDEIFLKYVLNFFQSYYYKQYCQSITNKSGQAFYNLSRQKLLQCLIPLPPLAEQKRIVAKLEQLFKVL